MKSCQVPSTILNRESETRLNAASTAPPVRVVFCWTNISGYMAACWPKMAADASFELHVLAYQSSTETPFAPDLMTGIRWTPLSVTDRQNPNLVLDVVAQHAPDVVVIAGWLNPVFIALTQHTRL